MPIPSKAEQLEEYAGQIGATAKDLFEVWFTNNAPEDLQQRVTELFNWPRAARPCARMPFPKMSRWSRGQATVNWPST